MACWLTAALLLGVFAGCQKEAKSTKAAAAGPAKVATIAKEDQLNTIVLTPQAEDRLGIATASVELRSVQKTRTYGGEVTLPTGALIVVSAPLGGTLQPVSKSEVPRVGAVIRFGACDALCDFFQAAVAFGFRV